jgi:hypothetical protein
LDEPSAMRELMSLPSSSDTTLRQVAMVGSEMRGERTELLDSLIVNIQTYTLQHAYYILAP